MKASCDKCGASWSGHRIEHCTACCHTFTGTTAGDLHRVGDHAVSVGPNRRRCLTVEEMEARGMARNSKGHWMSAAGRPQNSLPVRPQIDEQGGGGGLVQPGSTEAHSENLH